MYLLVLKINSKFFGKLIFIFYLCRNKRFLTKNIIMNLRNEIILMAISSFCNNDGIADFTYTNMNNICKNESFKEFLKPLIKDKLVEDLTENGYAKRIKVYNPIDCPDFIFIRMEIKLKEYVLQLWKDYQEFKEFKNRKTLWDTKLKLINLSDDDIINAKFIKNKISSDCTLILTEKGYKLVSRKENIKEYKCVYCGETNPDMFNKGCKTICKKCLGKIHRNEISLEEKLYKRSKKNANTNNYDFDLDIKFIKDLLTKQNNKCAYSGIKFQDNFNNKFNYPTIDRIDSTKGYTKDNVCICTFYINMMKSNLTIEQFKDTITKIYNNINNF